MRRLLLAALVLAALVPAIRLAWLSRDGPHLGFYHDDGLYWVTAKSLAGGGGYRIPSLPGAPYQTKYPPLFPLLLAAAWRVTPEFPASLGTAVWLTWLPLPILILLFDRLLARWGTDGVTRTVLGAALALNPYLAFFGTTLLSEMWASVFVLAALLAAARASSGLVAAAAYLTKTVCAPLVAALPLTLATKRKRLLFLACALPPVAAWHAWAAAHRAPATDWTSLYYLDYLGFYRADVTLSLLPALLYRNLGELFTAGGDLLLFKLSAVPFGENLSRLVMIAALAGVVRWTRSSRKLEYLLFAAGTFALLLVWNFPPNERFLLPLLPLLLLGLWTESRHLAGIARAAWKRPEVPQKIAAAVAALLLAGFAAALTGRSLDATWNTLPALAEQRRAATARALPLYNWIRAHTPAEATFFADRDTTLYLYTGRRATALRMPVRYFYAGDDQAILAASRRLPEFARARRLDSVLLTPADFELDPRPGEQRRAARRALTQDPLFRVVYDSPAGTVFAVSYFTPSAHTWLRPRM
ncbi:MAG: hypothetical protein HY822_11835 [Acidobacteria bacterium]|nr:hypothetical protein [Acidobacteriota bacterium]